MPWWYRYWHPSRSSCYTNCKFSIAIWKWMSHFPDMMSCQSMCVGNKLCWLLINRAILDFTSRIWTWPHDSKLGRLPTVQSSAGAQKKQEKKSGGIGMIPWLMPIPKSKWPVRWHRFWKAENTVKFSMVCLEDLGSDFSSCNVCVLALVVNTTLWHDHNETCWEHCTRCIGHMCFGQVLNTVIQTTSYRDFWARVHCEVKEIGTCS